jgi:hypothetical protein
MKAATLMATHDGMAEFVRELFRAGNEVHQLSVSETRTLIERANATITDLRERLAEGGNIVPLATDITSDLGGFLRHFDTMPEVLVGVTLFKCADEIIRLDRLATSA